MSVSSGSNDRSGNGQSDTPVRDVRMDLSDKVAVVTGGGRGIGRATSLELAREGIRAVAVVDFADDTEQVVAQMNRQAGRDVFLAFRGDVTDSGFRRGVFLQMEQRFGRVSICVPAAGITRDQLAVKVDRQSGEVAIYPESEFRTVMEVDLVAPIYWGIETIASVARDRVRRGAGRWSGSEPVEGCVIFIGSVSSTGNRGQVSYAAAKAGLEGAQGTLASEARYYGVRCAIVHPGYTDTRMVAALGDEFVSEHILPQTQLGRLISPAEIAGAIVFMIRNAAVSGKVWVDAGWHPRA